MVLFTPFSLHRILLTSHLIGNLFIIQSKSQLKGSPLQETFPPTRAGSSHFFIPTAIALYLFFQSLLIIFLLCNDTHRYKIYIYVYINQISGLKNYFNINTTLPHTHPNLNCSNPKLILLWSSHFSHSSLHYQSEYIYVCVSFQLECKNF